MYLIGVTQPVIQTTVNMNSRCFMAESFEDGQHAVAGMISCTDGHGVESRRKRRCLE